jgi:hypothetical protein
MWKTRTAPSAASAEAPSPTSETFEAQSPQGTQSVAFGVANGKGESVETIKPLVVVASGPIGVDLVRSRFYCICSGGPLSVSSSRCSVSFLPSGSGGLFRC